ncbi:MAG: hypothetical protein P4L45_13665, partial [Ignavibacteriaceae bacterium]|nr:hypothetical protein [Ignavibacteriaceae bacterium]
MQNRNLKKVFSFLCLFLLISSSIIVAQQSKKNMQSKKTPQANDKAIPAWNKDVRVSPKASVSQTIGISDIVIS